MTLIQIPTITTDRLRLRAFRAGDLDAYAAMQADPEVMRYLVTGRTSTREEVWRTMATFLGAWALRGYGMWACEKSTAARFLGVSASCSRSTGRNREIAYSLNRPYWGQGFATEAARAARDGLFQHFPLSRAASFIRPGNQASKRVTERLGAVYDGMFELRGSSYEYWVHYRDGPHP